MKHITIFFIYIFTTIFAIGNNVLKLEGIYRGENLYVMNPFNSSGVGYCVYEVKVNGQTTTDEINSSAFEIDLAIFNMNIGDKVTIEIFYHDGCKPRVLNPEVIQPRSTFSVSKISIDPSGYLRWTTYGEIGSLPFVVEQFKWNKWIPVVSVRGKGTAGYHTYTVKVNFHSGLNRFRIKQTDYTKQPRYSKEVTYNNSVPQVTFTPGKNGTTSDFIIFSRKTAYEIYDYYGRLKKQGIGNKVDVSDLPKGMYFLNYDNKTEMFNKK